jgi:hypothetical protein
MWAHVILPLKNVFARMCEKTMGQYRQWLLYREADQQLQSQIKESEKELAQLYAQIGQLEAETTYPENIILQMLIGIQEAGKANHQRPEAHAPSLSKEPGALEPQRGSVSPALFGWGNLPNFDTNNIHHATTHAQNQQIAPQFQQPDDDLLPQDLSAFTDDNNQTDPQISVPWWLRDTYPASKENPQSTQPIDQLSRRTNQYVQRWFERWGSSANESEQAQEKPGE